jgi:hypothetical protein
MRNKTTKITGAAAIEYAEEYGMALNKYADPTEDSRSDLSAEEARDVARQDPSLIWIDAPCRCSGGFVCTPCKIARGEV